MAFEQRPLEDLHAAEQGDALVKGWGRLDRLDEYDHRVRRRYKRMLSVARELAHSSLTASAIVDLEENSNYSEIADKLRAARTITKTVRRWQQQFSSEPHEAALLISNSSVAVFHTDPVEISRVYMTGRKALTPKTGAWVIVHPRRMTYDSVHGGKAKGAPQVGHYDLESGRGGGSCAQIIPLHEIAEGHHSQLHELPVPPLTIGRVAVGELYRQVAHYESHQSVTEHRKRTLSYAIWRVRTQDEGISDAVAGIADDLGLPNTWRDQYCTEVAAKMAHLIRKQSSGDQRESPSFANAFLWQTDWPAQPSELEILKPSESQMKAAILQQCRRLAISPNGEDTERALRYVTQRSF